MRHIYSEVPMLPFFADRKISSIIVHKKKEDGTTEVKGEEGEVSPALMAAAEDIIRAVGAKDATALAHALQSAMECSEVDYGSSVGDTDNG